MASATDAVTNMTTATSPNVFQNNMSSPANLAVFLPPPTAVRMRRGVAGFDPSSYAPAAGGAAAAVNSPGLPSDSFSAVMPTIKVDASVM